MSEWTQLGGKVKVRRVRVNDVALVEIVDESLRNRPLIMLLSEQSKNLGKFLLDDAAEKAADEAEGSALTGASKVEEQELEARRLSRVRDGGCIHTHGQLCPMCARAANRDGGLGAVAG